MRGTLRRNAGLIATIFLMGLVGFGGLLLLTPSSTSAVAAPELPSPTATPTVSATPSPSAKPSQPAPPTPKSCTPNKAIAAALGVGQGDMLVGSDVDWSLGPEAQPMNAFSRTELSSEGKLKSYLIGNSTGSRETRKLLNGALSSKQYDRAVSSEGWTQVQLKGEATVSLPDNYQLIDRKVVKRGSVSQPSEVFWVYVPDSCDGSTVSIPVAVRAWCGNLQLFARE